MAAESSVLEVRIGTHHELFPLNRISVLVGVGDIEALADRVSARVVQCVRWVI